MGSADGMMVNYVPICVRSIAHQSLSICKARGSNITLCTDDRLYTTNFMDDPWLPRRSSCSDRSDDRDIGIPGLLSIGPSPSSKDRCKWKKENTPHGFKLESETHDILK